MKKTLMTILIATACTSLSIGNAFAFNGGFKHANFRHGMHAQQFGRSNHTFSAAQFNKPHAFHATNHYMGHNMHTASAMTATAHHAYKPQNMAINSAPFKANKTSHAQLTKHTTNTVSVGKVSHSTHLTSHQVSTIKTAHAGTKTVAMHGAGPVIINPTHTYNNVHYSHPAVVAPYPVVVRSPVIIAPYGHGNYYYHNNDDVNAVLATALGISLFANMAQLVSANNHSNTVYATDTMAVSQPVAMVPYKASSTTSKNSQPVNVTVNNTINTATATPVKTSTSNAVPAVTAASTTTTAAATVNPSPLDAISGSVLATAAA